MLEKSFSLSFTRWKRIAVQTGYVIIPDKALSAMNIRKIFTLLAPALLISACASVPKPSGNQLSNDKPLETISNEQGRNVSRYVDSALLTPVQAYALPDFALKLPQAREDISDEQLAVLSNALNRSVCKRLGQYLVAETVPSETALSIEIALTGITPTSRTLSGLSAAADIFVPGPFRIPIGMGAISLDARATTAGKTAAFMRWAKGANPIFNSAKVSTIGDAYELLDTFTREFGQLLLQGSSTVKTRNKLDAGRIAQNEAVCESRYGKVDAVSKGASFLLPLAPEFIDKGKPVDSEPSTESE